MNEMEILEHGIIWGEGYQGSILLGGFCLFCLFCQYTTLELSSLFLALAECGDLKIAAQGVHGLCTHTVQTHALLEGLAVVFCACIDLAHYIHDLTQGDTPSIIAYRDRFSFYRNVHLFAVAHGVFVNT